MLQAAKIKGLSTELQCQLFFTQLGYNISIPLSEDCRYDFILDLGNLLLRIQVKTAYAEDNGIKFHTRSTHLSSSGSISHSYTNEDIDFFATYYNNQCYLVKVDDCGAYSKKLLFEKNSNNQVGALLIDYEAEKIIEKIKCKFNYLDIEPNNEKIEMKKEVIKIMQYDLDGNFINSYSSFAEAAKAVGAPRGGSHISQVVNGKRKTAYGCKWKKEIVEE